MDQPLSPFQLLDKALEFIAKDNKRYFTHEILKSECFANSNDIDVEAIVDRLKTDGNIRFGDPTQFKISLQGAWFLAQGAYQGDMGRNNAERDRLAAVEDFQHGQARRLNRLTAWIAGGTIALALIELLKMALEYHWFDSCH
jgi:hypothetical protein